MKNIQFLLGLMLFVVLHSTAQETAFKTVKNIHYYPEEINQSDAYINERCVLHIYYPSQKENFSTIVWFHGGGPTQGHKEIPEALKNTGVCVVGVNYRLHPKVKSPEYVSDADAAGGGEENFREPIIQIMFGQFKSSYHEI